MTQPPYQHDPYQQDPYQSGGYEQSGYQSGGYEPVPYRQPGYPPRYPPPYPPVGYGHPYPFVGRPPTSGFAITSLVLGILALLFCWIPVVGVIAWPLLVVGGALGIVALGPTRRGEVDGHGLAVAGVVCCGVALAVCLCYLVPFLLLTAAAGT